MKVCLLYEDHERGREKYYYDTESIIQDLGLDSLFLVASKEVIYDDGEVKKLEAEDSFVLETLHKTMMVPLNTKEEIEFRQDVVRDSLKFPDLIRGLYGICISVLNSWDEQGSGRDRINQGSPAQALVYEIRRLRKYCDALARIRDTMMRQNGLTSKGLTMFRGELLMAFPLEREANIRKLLDDVLFFTDRITVNDEYREKLVRPRIVLECRLEDGLKLGPMKVQEVSSETSKFFKRGGTREKIQRFMEGRIPDSFPTIEDPRVLGHTHQLEFELVNHLIKKLKNFKEEFRTFFEQLKFQTAFYVGAIQIVQHIERFGMEYCFPEVCDRRDLMFEDLKEFVMAIEQRIHVIGNTTSLKQKDLLIVTGANQGGKSTFLRSIGIALIMMQCGLPVTAHSFKSGIFPRIFVHFTRREDSAMNSGRLDEELKRMNDIIEHIGDGSLIMLNESFATTTEREGAVIAYDIIRALQEAGVRILTVTHLLSFAERVYNETKDDPDSGVAFLSAERRQDGTRTYHMIPGEPTFTSFGLDLYEKIVGNFGTSGSV